MFRNIFSYVNCLYSQDLRLGVRGESTLPQPGHGTDVAEIQIRPHSMVFPRPLLQMPYELERAAPLDYSRHVPDENLVCLSLPIYARAEVFTPTDNTECILLATLNRRGFGQGGDGLTAYGAVNRTDFTFRTRVFDAFPAGVRHHRRARLGLHEWNEMSLALSEHKATYWINGVQVATITFGHGDLPSTELYIGFISYSTPYRIRRFDVSRDPRIVGFVCSEHELRELSLLRQRIVTLNGVVLGDGVMSIACTGMAGDELANFDAVPTTMLLKDFRRILAEQLEFKEFDDVRLVLQDSTLLGANDDRKPVYLALQLGGPEPSSKQ